MSVMGHAWRLCQPAHRGTSDPAEDRYTLAADSTVGARRHPGYRSASRRNRLGLPDHDT